MRPFVPAKGLESPHAQTIYATFARPTLTPRLIEERWELPDGDFVDVSRLPAPPHVPHVLVLHGLESNSKAGYIAATLRAIDQRGWGAVAMNFRSCGQELNRLPRSYHASETGDALLALERLREHARGPIFGVGFSLGAGVILNLLAELGSASPFRAAAAVSVPFDYIQCGQAIDRGTGWMALYRIRFLRSMKRKVREKAKRFPEFFDLPRILKATTLREFDSLVTAPLHGFASVDDYYIASSSGRKLHEVGTPTLIVNSLDDPLIPVDSVPRDVSFNPALELELHTHGGHVAFVEGTAARPHFWVEPRVVEWLAERL